MKQGKLEKKSQINFRSNLGSCTDRKRKPVAERGIFLLENLHHHLFRQQHASLHSRQPHHEECCDT
jgi:hypothetical protein